MIDKLLNETRNRMDNTIKFLTKDLASISTGRANPKLLDPVKVEAYGNMSPINQVSNISVSDASTITIQVWDKGMVKPIEKAIISSNIGLTPIVDGQIIRISIPKLSEERRLEMVRLSKKYGEDKKIVIRNNRRDILDEFKKLEKDSAVSKDQIHSFSDKIQKITDEYIEKIDKLVEEKDKDLMSF